jgi:DNA-binding NarL/FixJ family response regulator
MTIAASSTASEANLVEVMAASRRSVLVVEDDALLRELFANALETHGFDVHTAASAADARRVFTKASPDAVLLDINLGAGPTGLDLAKVFRTQDPTVALVFLTNVSHPNLVADENPAKLEKNVAYLKKSAVSDIRTLFTALDEAMRGRTPREFRHDLSRTHALANLTQKQVTALRLISQGHTNAQIADHFGITKKAAEDLITRVFRALGLEGDADINLRVSAARKYFEATEPFFSNNNN